MATNAPDTIGPETLVHGTVTGSEPLHVQGRIEGRIELDNVLVIATTGRVKAEVSAREVVVEGHVEGTVKATERVVLRKDGQADGDITTPRIVVEDGSVFNGNLHMTRDTP